MHRIYSVLVSCAIFVTVLTGCQGHQAKVDALQKEYDQLGEQFRKDCNAEYLKVPPALSPKCDAENKKVQDAWNRLQIERAKQ